MVPPAIGHASIITYGNRGAFMSKVCAKGLRPFGRRPDHAAPSKPSPPPAASATRSRVVARRKPAATCVIGIETRRSYSGLRYDIALFSPATPRKPSGRCRRAPRTSGILALDQPQMLRPAASTFSRD